MSVAGRSAQRNGHSDPAPGTLAFSWGARLPFYFNASRGALHLQVGRLSISYLRVGFEEMVDSYIAEVTDLPSMVRRRVSEPGVSN